MRSLALGCVLGVAGVLLIVDVEHGWVLVVAALLLALTPRRDEKERA